MKFHCHIRSDGMAIIWLHTHDHLQTHSHTQIYELIIDHQPISDCKDSIPNKMPNSYLKVNFEILYK